MGIQLDIFESSINGHTTTSTTRAQIISATETPPDLIERILKEECQSDFFCEHRLRQPIARGVQSDPDQEEGRKRRRFSIAVSVLRHRMKACVAVWSLHTSPGANSLLISLMASEGS